MRDVQLGIFLSVDHGVSEILLALVCHTLSGPSSGLVC